MNPVVQLKPLTEEDIHDDFQLIQKNEQYLEVFGEGYPTIKTANDYYRYLLSLYGDMEAVAMKRFTIIYQNQRVGQIGLHSFMISNFTPQCEIFYWVDEQFQGKGIVTQACRLIQEHAFNVLGVELMIIHCLVSNEKSAGVAQRCNFNYEGISKLYDYECRCKIDYKRFIKSVEQHNKEKDQFKNI